MLFYRLTELFLQWRDNVSIKKNKLHIKAYIIQNESEVWYMLFEYIKKLESEN